LLTNALLEGIIGQKEEKKIGRRDGSLHQYPNSK